MEYLETDLAKLIADSSIMINVAELKSILIQILEGLDFMHQNFLMHRDLAPSNLLLNSEGNLKIIDFGLAKHYGSPSKCYSTGVITRHYRPPEVLFGSKYYGPAVDVWSAGCIFGELLLRMPLFPGSTDIDQLAKIFTVRGTPNPEVWKGVDELPNYLEFTIKAPRNLKDIFQFASPTCLDLLDKMLQLDPNNRISAAEALKHEFFLKEEPLPVKK
mmetsp:Transcript_25929/g.25185  ORF Transcript_25929/g.25185 Transcript_25929/m.25185 type:complete len:216 (-) Transcript_25929:51-698(-)